MRCMPHSTLTLQIILKYVENDHNFAHHSTNALPAGRRQLPFFGGPAVDNVLGIGQDIDIILNP